MKVFKFDKNLNQEFTDDVERIKLENDDGFDKIVINNPLESEKLCIIHSLKLDTFDKINKAQIIISSISNNPDTAIKIGCINILCISFGVSVKENILLEEIHMNEDDKIDIFNNKFLIILPGGSFVLKLDRLIDFAEMEIGIIEEKI